MFLQQTAGSGLDGADGGEGFVKLIGNLLVGDVFDVVHIEDDAVEVGEGLDGVDDLFGSELFAFVVDGVFLGFGFGDSELGKVGVEDVAAA